MENKGEMCGGESPLDIIWLCKKSLKKPKEKTGKSVTISMDTPSPPATFKMQNPTFSSSI
jgi:hypothetical protein